MANRKPMPPYGRQLIVSGLRCITLFVGEPQCWQAARHSVSFGLHCFLCLPQLKDCQRYYWPVEDADVAAIVYNSETGSNEARLIACLSDAGANEIVVRHWPSTDLIIYRYTQ